MDFNHDTGLIGTGLQSLDVSTTPPLGGTAGVLSIIGTGAIVLTTGTTAQRPTGVAGMFRYNSDLNKTEFYNGTIWIQDTGGTVTSVAATGSTGLTVGGSPITTSGTLTFTLASILQSLSSLATSGLTVNNAGTISAVTLAGTAGNIVVTNGSGVSGAPTFNLATVGTPVTGFFGQVTTDTFGRVTATAAATSANITTALGYTPVNKAGDTMSGALNMGSQLITNVATPVSGTDAANKNYVDATVTGLSWKQAVRVATTSAGTLATSFAAGSTVDGITLAAGDRILIKNQAAGAENGIYIVNATGAPTRAPDSDIANELVGEAVFVTEGTALGDTGWIQTANAPITLGTTALTYSQFSGSGTYTAGTGLSLSGNVFSLSAPVSIALGGTGLSTAPANGALDIGNGTGFTRTTLTQGSGVTITNGAGSISIANSGVLSITGTANQVIASAATGAVTLSLPQSIATTSTPTFAGLIDTGLTANSFIFSGTGSQLTSTGAPSNGQLLIGSTGAAPVLGSLTAGTAISVTNGAGTITIANTGVTSNVAGSGISVSGATGAVTISNTGVTSLIAGTGISVSSSTGGVTVSNTGVTSVGLGLPNNLFAVSTPVTTTGTLSGTYITQTTNTVFAAPNGSTGTPSFRALVAADMPFKLYAESQSSPTAPSATGTNSVAIGSGAAASATGAFAVGAGSSASIYGTQAYANGSFATAGDAQSVQAVLRNVTTTATATELFLDGVGATQRFVLPNNSNVTFSLLVTARRTDATGGSSGYKFEGVIRKDGTVASTTFTGTPSKAVLGETNAAWDVVVSADTTNGSLKVTVTGEAAKTIRWVGVLNAAIVTN